MKLCKAVNKYNYALHDYNKWSNNFDQTSHRRERHLILHKLPFSLRDPAPTYYTVAEATRVHMSIGSAAFVGLTIMPNRHSHTDHTNM